jgi:hypothetical protein
MPVFENVEKLILALERRPPLYKRNMKEYGDRSLKGELWNEVCESVVTNLSELPAEQKSAKGMLILLFPAMLVDTARY